MKTPLETLLRDAALPISVRYGEAGLFAIYHGERAWSIALDSVHATKEYCALRDRLLSAKKN